MEKNEHINVEAETSEYIENTEASQNIKNSKIKDLLYFLPLIFIIVIIPLITRAKVVQLHLEEADFWKGGLEHVDFFSYYKSEALVIATCIALVMFGLLLVNKKLTLQNYKRYYIPMCIYSLFVIISTLLSQNKNTSIIGFIEMYQGMSVLLCYILLLFILMNFLKNIKDIKILLYSFAALSIAVGIIGLSQYFGHDFLQTSIGHYLMTPDKLKGAKLNFIFGKYTLYGTMYNTNFVGSFAAIVLPITTALFISSENLKGMIIFYISAILSYTTWLGCNSRAGYIGIIATTIIGAIIFRNVIKEKFKRFLLLFIGFIIVTIVLNITSGGRQLGQFARLNPILEAEKLEKIKKDGKIRFEEISVSENTFTIKTTKETLVGIVKDNDISFRDEENNILEINKSSDGKISFKDEKYNNYIFKKDLQSRRIEGSIYKRPFHLYSMNDNTVKVISFNNKLMNPVNAPHIKIFDKRETFASNRGYIWSRTIPMLKDTIFIGYGPDNFCMMFPQEDYVGRFNTGSGMTDIIVDKPHNMYLQTAVNTGGISLLALLFIWIIYIMDSISIYIKGKQDTFLKCMGASLFLSIFAYLIAGIFNDNIVSVAPLFWVALGIGININSMNKIDKSNIQC